MDTDQQCVWQWEDDSGWRDYDQLTSAQLEKAFSEKKTTVNLNQGYYATRGGYTVNFGSMSQINNSTQFARRVQRTNPTSSSLTFSKPASVPALSTSASKTATLPLPIPQTEEEKEVLEEDSASNDFSQNDDLLGNTNSSAYTGVPYWEWLSDHNWNRYDNETSQMIEEAYAQKQPTLTLNHGFFASGGGYTLNLTTFTQIRESTGYGRQVRRVPAGVPVPAATNTPAELPRRNRFPFSAAPAEPAAKKHRPEMIRSDPEVMNELHAALQLLSRREGEVEEVYVEEIYVDD